MELIGKVMCYDWGKLGQQSLVAQLAQANNEQLEINPECPYAELWIGDHVNGPATVKSDGKGIDEIIKADPVGMIGKAEGGLPFLLKVLSIRKALSVQVHPDKKEAEKLHRNFPDIYKDPNHKPELAIALTDFEVLCGFRQLSDIIRLLKGTPELQNLIGHRILEQFANENDSAVKFAFESLMLSEPDSVKQCIERIADRMRTGDAVDYEPRDLFLRLYNDFGCDVGVLSIYFLNYIRLTPGDAIYLAANVPHAYLDGDCVECMACSDNVVRAGLTPKFKDVDTLLQLVEYDLLPGTAMLFHPTVLNPEEQPFTSTYKPSIPDFSVAKISIPSFYKEYSVSNPANGSVLLVVSGKAMLYVAESAIELRMGKIVFLPSSAGRKFRLKLDDADELFLAFQAMANVCD